MRRTILPRRHKIHKEAQYVKEEDERNDPFQNGSHVVRLTQAFDAEAYGQPDFDEDEVEFDPEGVAEDAELAIVDAEALVFGADEDGVYDVADAVR